MKIRNFLHKGLKRLYVDGSARGLPPENVAKLRNMLAFLKDMHDPEALRSLPTWKAHVLSGTRAGTWGLHVTKTWRLTFLIDIASSEVYDVDYEDYH